MPIPNILQPEILPVAEGLRLRKFDDIFDFALEWYQDTDLVWQVDGDRVPYTPELLAKMYRWLNDAGELYFIEVLENGTYKPIGDVTFWQEDMPIVIGEARYRGKGIGKAVISALIQRGRDLGFDTLHVEEIYDWNTASRTCFQSMGFQECGKTKKGNRFVLYLK